ncbi:hypothetical protein ANCDUO_21520, partial [Ancylostoma duodenale]
DSQAEDIEAPPARRTPPFADDDANVFGFSDFYHFSIFVTRITRYCLHKFLKFLVRLTYKWRKSHAAHLLCLHPRETVNLLKM